MGAALGVGSSRAPAGAAPRACPSTPSVAGSIGPGARLNLARTRASARRLEARLPRVAAEREHSLPLTVAQRGIWIGGKIARPGTVFAIAEAVEIKGPVEPELFIAALRRITEEAETTRVNIHEDARGPRQIVHRVYRGDIPFIDCTGAADAEDEARRWMMADVTAPIDLERDPLWFSALLKTAPDRYLWHHRAHHIIYDGYSGGLAARRGAEIYNALLAGETPPPSPFEPLRALVEAEAEYRASGAFARDRQYWLDRLADLPDPVSFAQGRLPTASGLCRRTALFSAEKTGAVRALAKSLSATMPQMLIALAAAFIYRTTGAGDLVLGMPVSARTRETRAIPGMAANGILLRLALAPGLDLAALTAETAREVQHALRRQRYRFEDMRRDLGFTGQHQHIARIAVNIEPFDYNLTFGGHETSAHNLANSSVEDLVIFIYDRGDGRGLRVDFDANPSLYTEDELDAHRRRFERFVDAVLADPASAIGDIDLLDEEERRKLFALWNDTAHAVPDKPVFELIEDQARRAPDALAVRCGGTSFSYGELNGCANHLARALIGMGIGAGDIVALALPRSEKYPIAMLAVSKTGAAFLPVDPADPPARLAQIFDDAEVKAIIALSEDMGRLPLSAAPVIDFDAYGTKADPRAIADRERSAPLRLADPAYVIYTSGSTGEPKGVVLHHAGLTNMIVDAIDRFPLGPGDRLMAVAALTFDASIFDLHAPLAAGAALIIAPGDIVRKPRKIAEAMRREAVTAMLVTPPLWEALIATRAAPLSGLKAGVAGEALTSRLARALTGLGARLINFYGPTEATVQCTAMTIDETGLAAPPIGRPIWNTRAYILDDALKPLPPGVAGELCIGGAGVGLGYLKRTALTAARFPPDPYDPAGGRLYRTGDLARWRADGVLEFLGRRDQQLKIRGFRIEPGEVEAAFYSCPGVKAAFVSAIENPKGGKRLAAWLAPKDGATLDKTAIRSALAARLPDHLVPSAIFVLDEMPLTRSGKIDRGALPKTDDRPLSGYVAPRTPTEQKLADIFASMLGLEKVGVEDNFFELGADSLTAVQLLIEIETQFSMQLSLLSLFDAPTIANLARQMEAGVAPDPFATVFPLRRTGEAPPLFCIHSVVGICWSYAGLLRHLDERHPVYGLQARGLSRADGAPLPASVEAMAEDYLAEIRKIDPQGPYRLLGWSLGGLVAHAIAVRLEAAGERVQFLGLLDAFPFTHGSAREAGSEAALVEAALRSLHFDPAAMANRPRDMAGLADFVFREFDVFSTPLVKKAGLDDDLRRRFQAVVLNNFRVAMEYRPRPIKADMHVFRAKDGKDGDLDALIEHGAGAWRRYTSGSVFEHDLACGHFAMLNAEPLETIGPILRNALG